MHPILIVTFLIGMLRFEHGRHVFKRERTLWKINAKFMSLGPIKTKLGLTIGWNVST